MSGSGKNKPSVGDLAGAGEIINSQVAKWTYKDGVSSSVKQVGALTTDTLKTLRLFTAPLQLLAAYQDRFEKFCDRVRDRVPEVEQCAAPPEIARPVMEAFASTSDDSPMMSMFEELMAKAIDKREANKLSPEFPEIIRSLSPMQALLLSRLKQEDQYTDVLRDPKINLIVNCVGASFDFDEFGGSDHHLTLVQSLAHKNLVAILPDHDVPDGTYSDIEVPKGFIFKRSLIRLTMYGKWFADAVTARK